MKIIPFLLTLVLTDYRDTIDIQVCSIKECHELAKTFTSKEVIQKICFKNVPEKSDLIYIKKDCP